MKVLGGENGFTYGRVVEVKVVGGENGFSIWFRNDRKLCDRKIWVGRGFKEEIILRQLTFIDIFLDIKDFLFVLWSPLCFCLVTKLC